MKVNKTKLIIESIINPKVINLLLYYNKGRDIKLLFCYIKGKAINI
jgi:hypothetical protein